MADGYRFDILEKRAERKAHLDDIGVATLPDQPGKRGYSAAESKMHFKAPVDYLFSLLCGCMEEVGSEFDGYAPLSGADFTGDVTIGGSLSVSGGIACDGSSVLFEKDISELRATVAKHENNLYAYISHSDEEGALVATEIIKGVSPDKGDDGDALATTEWTNGAIAEEASVREAKDGDLEASIEALRKDFDDLKSIVYGIHSLTYNSHEFAYLTSSAIPEEVDGRKVVGGSYAIMDWVGGNSVAFNQLVKNGNFADTSNWYVGSATFSVSNNVATITPTAIRSTFRQSRTFINGHKYLYKFDIKYGNGEKYYINVANVQTNNTGTGNWESKSAIIAVTNTNNAFNIYDYDNYIHSEWQLKNVMVFDLTLMGLDNITSVDKFKALFPLDYYPYQENNIKSTILSKIEAYSTEGVKLGQINIPNAPLRLDGVNDVHNALTFEEQSDGTYNAILTRNILVLDLGTINWGMPNSNGWVQTTDKINTKPSESSSTMPNAICDKYTIGTPNKAYTTDGYISINTSSYLTARDSSFIGKTRDEMKTTMSGVNLLCESATPTSEVIATGLTFEQVSFLTEKGGTIEAVYEGVPPTASVDFMTKGE